MLLLFINIFFYIYESILNSILEFLYIKKYLFLEYKAIFFLYKKLYFFYIKVFYKFKFVNK